MVLVDQQGNRIHATIKKNLLPNFGSSVEVRNTLEINTFLWLMVDNQHKIIFCRATRVKRVAGIELVGDGYSFIPYTDIRAGLLNTNIAFDIVGQVVEMGNMKIKMQDGRQTKLLTFVLQDADGTKLDCALWCEYSVQLNTFVEKSKSSHDVTVMFIHVAFAKPWDDKYQVSNSLFGTKVYINSDIQPIVQFRERLLQNAEVNDVPTPPPVLTINTVIERNGDFYMRFPRKSIDCLRSIRETTHCIVIATLLSVVTDDGWFYYICKTCAKTVTRNLEATHDGHHFQCGPINETESKVRTVIRVEDSTGTTSFSMFGDVVARFLKKTEHWLSLKMKQASDPTEVPTEWENYINKKIVFKIKVSLFNLTSDCAGYTVGRCTDDTEVVNEQLQRPVATLVDLPDEDHDFVTSTTKGLASNFGDNVSPIPFEDLNMEGSSNKRKSQTLDDDTVIEESSSKKPLFADD